MAMDQDTAANTPVPAGPPTVLTPPPGMATLSPDMMALLQILQLQSQETRAAMDAMYNRSQQVQAQQTQMVIDLVKTMAPGKGSASPTLGSEGYVKKLDESIFAEFQSSITRTLGENGGRIS